MASNPLASRSVHPPADPAMLQHAQAWQAMHSKGGDELQQFIRSSDYNLPVIGALASNPKVTAKDVIKATSAAVADQKISPSEGVAFITQIPPDPDKLRGWLHDRYAMGLSAAVHAKAALMARNDHPSVMPMGQAAPPGAAPMPLQGGQPQ